VVSAMIHCSSQLLRVDKPKSSNIITLIEVFSVNNTNLEEKLILYKVICCRGIVRLR
jgi:hypothetical protein